MRSHAARLALINISDFEWRLVSPSSSLIFLLVQGKIQASKQKPHIVKCSVVLSALLAECSHGSAEGCSFQVLFLIPRTVTNVFGN